MTNQAPIQSGFGGKSTATEVLGGRSLEGTIAIVTGGYAGIGLETTRALAGAGATVIVPAGVSRNALTVSIAPAISSSAGRTRSTNRAPASDSDTLRVVR